MRERWRRSLLRIRLWVFFCSSLSLFFFGVDAVWLTVSCLFFCVISLSVLSYVYICGDITVQERSRQHCDSRPSCTRDFQRTWRWRPRWRARFYKFRISQWRWSGEERTRQCRSTYRDGFRRRIRGALVEDVIAVRRSRLMDCALLVFAFYFSCLFFKRWRDYYAYLGVQGKKKLL